jgi:glutaredoxin
MCEFYTAAASRSCRRTVIRPAGRRDLTCVGVESAQHLYMGGWKVVVKLHRCPNMWVKIGAHPCWKVQSALDDQGLDYEVVKGPLRRSQRVALEKLSGQRQYPVIEVDDGTVYREESKDMAARIRRGELLEGQTPVA